MDAYPLCWPEGWKRTPANRRTRAKFGKGERQYSSVGTGSWMRKTELSVSDATRRILGELEKLGIDRQDIVISTNVRLRLDGLPRSGEKEPDDPGAAAYWVDSNMGNQNRCMAVDRYDRVADNLAAIAATLDAMRAIERHGGASILSRAFTGFTALPAPGTTTTSWRQLFGNVATAEALDLEYRKLRSAHHPDKGGDSDMFNTVQRAYEQASKDLAARA